MSSTRLYNEWMKYAQADYTAAVHLTSHHPIQLEIVCFHCQQAGEKALKAVLAFHDEPIPRTHNLYELLQLCEVHYPEIVDALVNQADQLTNFAVVARYPNDEMAVTETDMKLALTCAEQVSSYIKKLII
ncbi:MAG: HEPN domain-containing protein [Defluviitaleaceae bacterium]|nr:HEPN domain-containing protein [Defluviitaleaceae bacterium]